MMSYNQPPKAQQGAAQDAAPTLKELQADFKHYLMREDPAIAAHIASSQRLSNDTRLAIYSHAYYARLAEALESDFGSIRTLLSETDFNELCQRYTDCNPSTNPSLRWFGQHMAMFLSQTSPYNESPYLAELAVLEWAFVTAFDAPDANVASEQDAAQVPAEQWPHLTLSLHPSVVWFEYHWNILPLWRATNQQNDEPNSIPTPKALDVPEQCVVWRQGLTTQYRTLEPDEAILLSKAAAGAGFSQMCEALVGLVDDPNQLPLRAASLLKSWLSSEMISHLG